MVPYTFFESEYDVTYNSGMHAFHTAVETVVAEINDTVKDLTDIELQAFIDDELEDDFVDTLQALIQANINFCCGETVTSSEDCGNEGCSDLFELQDQIETLEDFTTGPQLRSTIDRLIKDIFAYSPFNTFGQAKEVNRDTVVPVVRGGVAQNLSNRFAFFTKTQYYTTATKAYQNDWEFDDYFILSDGAAGSTTCIFTSMASQIYKNRQVRSKQQISYPRPSRCGMCEISNFFQLNKLQRPKQGNDKAHVCYLWRNQRSF